MAHRICAADGDGGRSLALPTNPVSGLTRPAHVGQPDVTVTAHLDAGERRPMDHVVVPLTRVKVWTSEGIWTEAQNGAAGLFCTTFGRKVDRVGTSKIDSKATAMMGSAILNGKMKRAGRPRSGPVRRPRPGASGRNGR